MDKIEFLKILRQALTGEVSNVIIEKNISYYDQYIGASTKEEEERIINELGDPRLIAKTIIETDKIAKERGKHQHYENYSTSDSRQEETSSWEHSWDERNSGIPPKNFFINLSRRNELIAVLVLLVLIAVISIVGRLVIGLLFALGPVIILFILLAYLFRRR